MRQITSAAIATVRLGACTAIACFALTPSAHALVFNFEFDNVPNRLPLDPPIVGTGTFSFDGNPGPGSFALSTLTNFNFNFDFDIGFTFTNADLNTNPSDVLVEISTVGSEFSLNFTGNSDPFNGSLAFTNASGPFAISFEPGAPGIDRPELYFTLQLDSDEFFGNFGSYQATTQVPSPLPTPVPGPLPLLGAGAAFGWSRKLRKRIKSSKPDVIPTV